MILKLCETTRDREICESSILQILLSQFDSGRGLQKFSCFVFLKKVCWIYSSVAQLVEQLTVNQLVAGSSPARGAKFTQFYPNQTYFVKLVKFSLFEFLIKQKKFCLKKSNLNLRKYHYRFYLFHLCNL